MSALCLLLDPISDLAVLASPGDLEQADAYQAFITSVTPLRISDATKSSRLISKELGEAEAPVWLLSLTGDLIPCRAEYVDDLVGSCGVPDTLRLRGGEIPRSRGLPPRDPIPAHFGENLAGMLGSPIVVADGSAIGVMTEYRRGPRLTDHLPGWLLRELTRVREE